MKKIKELHELCVSPTPWEYEEETNDIICHLDNGLRFQVATPYLHMDGDSTEDNARMMCASPLMFQRLLESTNMLKNYVVGCKQNGTVVPQGVELQIQVNESALRLASEGDDFKVANESDDEEKK